MAVDLGETAIDPTLPQYRAMLENLQANILKSHGRNEADHLLLRFTGSSADVRSWLQGFADEHLTSARRQLEETAAYRGSGAAGGLVGTLYLSAGGYTALGLDARRFPEEGEAFRRGMKAQRFRLLFRNRDPPPTSWEAPFRQEVHALVALAHDEAEILQAATREVQEGLRGVADVLTVERGTALRNDAGEAIEHFGFVDARSQPLFLKEDIEAEEQAEGTDRWDPSAPLRLVLLPDPLASEEESFGSYFVFRKLEEDVAGFNAGVRALAAELGVGEDLAGAYAVGRFKDGTPVTLQFADGLRALNNFAYLPHDPDGGRCPFHAHIRKANQRGANRNLSLEEERDRRIVRRGIPYGIRGPDGVSPGGPVGLLFTCFQRDIGRQFEFIQRAWVDNPNFPEFLLIPGLNTGDDALIGQHPRGVQKWPRRWDDQRRFLGRRTVNFGDYVTLRGGEYFFAPSLSFLRGVA